MRFSLSLGQWRIDGLLDQARTSQDQAARKAAYEEAVRSDADRAAADRERYRIENARADRQRKIAVLFRDADTFLQQQQYAAGCCHHTMKIPLSTCMILATHTASCWLRQVQLTQHAAEVYLQMHAGRASAIQG